MENLRNNITCLDLLENGNKERTSAYLIQGEKTVLIETGASPSIPAILEQLNQLNVSENDVDAVAVTHIHLDHSGGAGLLMKSLPNAVLLSPPKGAKHLIDPEKLIQSAKGVYGELFDKFFDPILPIAADKVKVMNDGDEFELGNGRKLVFYDGHGHAFHHSIIHDTGSGMVFTGDAAGIHFRGLKNEFGKNLAIPVTSPTQFQPEIMKETIEKIRQLKPTGLCLTHYGMIKEVDSHLDNIITWLDLFTETLVDELGERPEAKAIHSFLSNALARWFTQNDIPDDHSLAKIIAQDVEVNAQGIYHYLQSK